MSDMKFLFLVILTAAATGQGGGDNCDLVGLCDGTFLDVTTAENKGACINFCLQTPDCFWFSLDTSSQVCPLSQNTISDPPRRSA